MFLWLISNQIFFQGDIQNILQYKLNKTWKVTHQSHGSERLTESQQDALSRKEIL